VAERTPEDGAGKALVPSTYDRAQQLEHAGPLRVLRVA
jgi:hypothetical protein